MSRIDGVSVLLLSWNGREHLATCLEALAAQEPPGVPWEILVLDNGSRDGTADWLRREHPGVRLHESAENVGFCRGNLRLAGAARHGALALLNNDMRPRSDWLGQLVESLGSAPDDVAAVSGLIVDWEGERLDFGRGLLTFDGHAFQLDYRRPLAAARLPAPGEELPFACGGNMLVRREAFFAAGAFDPDFFAYFEDVDLGWRLWSGGERVLAAPAAVAHHRASASSDRLGLFNRGLLFERNALLTAFKNLEPGWWERLMPAILTAFLSRTRTMLVEGNAGGATLAVDPYAPGAGGLPGEAARERSGLARRGRAWVRRKARSLVGRVVGLPAPLRAQLAGGEAGTAGLWLADPRSVAQLRALSFFLDHLDAAAEKRRQIQARRRRRDADYFARFPLHLVATYPGDAELFARPGFRALLPADLPLVEVRLDEIMEWG
ncbi:MAG: glycosyltransferase family 2 protein [Thermoanaerobaculia bacterium]|nr:glycosyltransferase family 2 protein [Thermoanaerobaculia bacterium]MCZ7649667.1 glycosyltransferase family 2 protein [Thermoanaerobaculia bacterium]